MKLAWLSIFLMFPIAKEQEFRTYFTEYNESDYNPQCSYDWRSRIFLRIYNWLMMLHARQVGLLSKWRFISVALPYCNIYCQLGGAI